MASMLRDVSKYGNTVVNVDALRSDIRKVLIDQKSNACPIAMRMAWHAAGTYDAADGSGGCNGGRIRFEPESNDPDNAGLSIIRDLLLPVKKAYPQISHSDLYAVAGCTAVEFLGGPRIPFRFGRTDEEEKGHKGCPHGRLPDASKGAPHLREVFGKRMGFSDQEIVALSGAHTLGRCHAVRSGFDGPWTTHPLRFDNEYFVNLINRTWVPKKWTGPHQFEDVESGKLMMLPTDIALIEDPGFRKYVELYAKDEKLWYNDFANAYAKLLSLGCPAVCNPFTPLPDVESPVDKASAEFREYAMHGSVLAAKKCLPLANVHQLEATSGRSALHKAAFWGHNDMIHFLLSECKLNPDVQDNYGDTPLHDAAKFGHEKVVGHLLAHGARTNIKNLRGQTALEVAKVHQKTKVVEMLSKQGSKGKSKL